MERIKRRNRRDPNKILKYKFSKKSLILRIKHAVNPKFLAVLIPVAIYNLLQGHTRCILCTIYALIHTHSTNNCCPKCLGSDLKCWMLWSAVFLQYIQSFLLQQKNNGLILENKDSHSSTYIKLYCTKILDYKSCSSVRRWWCKPFIPALGR